MKISGFSSILNGGWMKKLILLLLLLNTVSSSYGQNSVPVVKNVQVGQRPGTKLINITFDVSDSDNDPLNVIVRISAPGSNSFQVETINISGDVGEGIMPGTGKTIVWNSGIDCPNNYGSDFKVMIHADDGRGNEGHVNDGYGDYLYVPSGIYSSLPTYLDGFYIGKFEITNGEYKKFLNDGGYITQSYWSAGGFNESGTQPRFWEWDSDTLDGLNWHGGGISGNENYPVFGVNWYEAMAYCSWLSIKTGRTYTLPSPAQWGKAALGTDVDTTKWGWITEKEFPWGDEIDSSYANYWDSGDPEEHGATPAGFYDGSAHGSFQTSDGRSQYGAFDMAGNVGEWCIDSGMRVLLNTIIINPKVDPSSSRSRVKGGSFFNGTSSLRIDSDFAVGKTHKSHYAGFRGALITYATASFSIIPLQHDLDQNYPNPFNLETTIKFKLAKSENVEVKICNIIGQEIKTLLNKSLPAGEYSVKWDGTNSVGGRVSSGVYIYRISADGVQIASRKMILLK